MRQQYTSQDTSINKINYIFKHFIFPKGSVILDYGCGRYNTCKDLMEKQGMTYLPYDPYNRDKITNDNSIQFAKKNGVTHIICANVLNVIKEEDVIKDIIRDISSLCNKDTQVIISVYAGDKSGNGKPTTKGYQRNESLYNYYKWFEPYFNVVYWKNCFICTLK